MKIANINAAPDRTFVPPADTICISMPLTPLLLSERAWLPERGTEQMMTRPDKAEQSIRIEGQIHQAVLARMDRNPALTYAEALADEWLEYPELFAELRQLSTGGQKHLTAEAMDGARDILRQRAQQQQPNGGSQTMSELDNLNVELNRRIRLAMSEQKVDYAGAFRYVLHNDRAFAGRYNEAKNRSLVNPRSTHYVNGSDSQINALVKQKIAASDLGYASAMRVVLSENPTLAEEYKHSFGGPKLRP